MKPLSIRLRLSLMVSVLALAVIIVLSIAAYVEFKESLLGNIDATLKAMAEGMRATLDGEESRESREGGLRAITGHDEAGTHTRYRVWMDAAEESLFVSGSPDGSLERRILYPPVEERPDMGQYSLFNVSGEGEFDGRSRYRVIWFRFLSDERPFNLLVARSCDYVYHELAEFSLFLLVLGGSVMLLILLLVPIIISSGLRAITDMGAKLRKVTRSNLMDDSYTTSGVPHELGPFTSALREMLLRLHKAIEQQEQLTADVAHELRTPLAVIKSTLQTLRIRSRTTTEYEEGIDDALADVDRMESLIAQLLSLARLDAQEGHFTPTKVRLDTLLESVVSGFRERAERRGQTLIYTDGTPVSVRADQAQLRQLFTNLLDNAIRHGPQGGRIHVTVQDGPEAQATVRIRDEGGAIPAESLPRLFDRFYRVDSSRSQMSGGSGLGLAIAREIVQRHHGDITITSDQQAGTSVIVHLPRM